MKSLACKLHHLGRLAFQETSPTVGSLRCRSIFLSDSTSPVAGSCLSTSHRRPVQWCRPALHWSRLRKTGLRYELAKLSRSEGSRSCQGTRLEVAQPAWWIVRL